MRILLSTLVVCLLPLAGCTIGNTPTTSTAPTGPSTETASPASAAATPSAGEPSPVASDLPVLAARKTSLDGTPATISLNELSVHDGVTTLTWTVTNDRPAGTSGVGIQMQAGTFGDGQTARVPGTDNEVPEDRYYVDGVYLVDGVNKLRYLPARDSQGACVCSYAPSSTFIRAGQSLLFSAVFKGVPDGVDTVDVTIPRAGTFTKVPVQR